MSSYSAFFLFRQKKFKDLSTVIVYLAPSFLVFSVFVFFPLFFSLYLSFHKWNLISPTKIFIGLGNFTRMFTKDPLFFKVMLNTTIFSLVVVVVSLFLGLALALILNSKIRGRTIYRAGIFLPYVTSPAAIALVWLWILDPKYGLLNDILRIVGIRGPEWLASVKWALPAIILMTIWRFVGYDMLLFIGGLQSLSPEIQEAAVVDGAGWWTLFWRITFPLLSPTTFFIAVTSFITMFQNFETIYVMTGGGPVDSTNMIVYYLYQNAFEFFEAGYASAIAVVLFLIVVTLTAIQFRIQGKWVHY